MTLEVVVEAHRHPARLVPWFVVSKPRTPLLVALVVVNLVVLLGQLWPEGAPTFARTVNIAFLVVSAATLTAVALRKL